MISAKLKHQTRLERIKAQEQPFTSTQGATVGKTGHGVDDPFLKTFFGGSKKR